MGQRTEYLITRHDQGFNTTLEIRAPKSANIKLLLERLICRDLDDEDLIASCLPKNSRLAYDPFRIVDEREEYRREQANAALRADSDTKDPIGVYSRARQAPIPLGRTLLFAGVDHGYFVKEVAAAPGRSASRNSPALWKRTKGEDVATGTTDGPKP